jgi:hypothetical protein
MRNEVKTEISSATAETKRIGAKIDSTLHEVQDALEQQVGGLTRVALSLS